MSLTWEIASGPSVGCNMSLRSTTCVINEGLKNSSLCMGPEYVLLGPQESVVWGLSSLSLCSQPQTEEDPSSAKDVRHKLGHAPMIESEINFSSTGSDLNYKIPSSGRIPEELSFVGSKKDVLVSLDPYIHKSSTVNSFYDKNCCSSVTQLLHCNHNSLNRTPARVGGCHGSLSNYATSLDTGVENHIWETPAPLMNVLEPDTISMTTSTSLSSSSSLVLIDNEPKNPESHKFAGETEAQSAYTGPSDHSLVESSPPRKGLSRCYSGKSRSFSCLADVASVKDLAKPENPYARKRRNSLGSANSSGRPRLPPLQKGSGILKKSSIHNSGKSTLALGVIMSTKDDVKNAEITVSKFPLGETKWQRGRSFSLSDLQGASASHFSPGVLTTRTQT